MRQYLLICIILILLPDKMMAQFTEKEKEIINSGSIDMPFRVLLITEKEDSVILRQKCEDITPVTDNEDLKLLIERLKVTMEIEAGVGIAAPQIGVCKNVFLFTRIDEPDFPVVAVINPKIVNHPNETVCFERDGCLSIPDASGNSVRYAWVDVEYTNEDGELVRERLEGYSRAGNFTGVVFQHEYDHLQGVLFTDKLCTIEGE